MCSARSTWMLALPVLLWLSACVAPRHAQTCGKGTVGETPQQQAISLLGRPLSAPPPNADLAKLAADLAAARAAWEADPDDPGKLVWVGRRLGYLWRMNEAIACYSRGIERYPEHAPLYRHRGHRYISIRRFGDAIADLERATELIRGRPDTIEQDGMPNEQGVPLTTTAFNVWYHLGLARYLTRDLEGALSAFHEATKLGRGHDDNLVATTDWMYMALRRLGREREAAALLDRIDADMEIIENRAYHRRLLMYKGLIASEHLLSEETASELDLATLGYGLGNWHLHNGQVDRANAVFRRVTAGPYWPAFGFIAAETALAKQQP